MWFCAGNEAGLPDVPGEGHRARGAGGGGARGGRRPLRPRPRLQRPAQAQALVMRRAGPRACARSPPATLALDG